MRAALFTSLVIVAAASGAVDERADLRALQEATTTATTTPHPLRDMYENMMQWWCSKPDNGESVVCKRRQLVGLLRSSPEKKSETLDALKKLGAPPSGAVRAVQDEYCRVPENASTSVCKNHGLAEEGKKMAEWFCSQEGKEATLYCQRSKLMLKMRTIPPVGKKTFREWALFPPYAGPPFCHIPGFNPPKKEKKERNRKNPILTCGENGPRYMGKRGVGALNRKKGATSGGYWGRPSST